ncbi:HD domain-containing protein [Synechococcus sp. RSCCF101]|uniref:HD domain-containing protein n=1 Tax=Synechococcus sp. RSCCF101 TaxID=2511069 RepID=UPI0012476C76|nr:HD domain-containing protein [Synechococcus sp. RSCCF101]QEY32106.1 HD domain-containing protein [Synechococcus sp. RSCCF101]
MTAGCRTYHDPLHGAISLARDRPAERLATALIDTPPFQRLRRIRQLGPAFLTFHGAESSRFTHSLGVLHLARRALGQLMRLDPALESHQALLYAAALLHDIGHGPLSHAGEAMFGMRHEHWSARIIREQPEVRRCLDSHAPQLAGQVADLLEHGRSPHPVVGSLVSSQLDCDRLDYLLRDSHSTGARYGQLDLDRLISALTLAPDGHLAIHAKGVMAAEHYLLVRDLMYRSVYNHRLNVVCNWLLNQVVGWARRLGPEAVDCDRVMARWLWPDPPLDVASYLAQDDLRLGYHLLRWREDGPAPLNELSARLLDRRLLKALDVSELAADEQDQLLRTASSLSRERGLDPALCCDLHRQSSRGYAPYRGGLQVWDGEAVHPLETRSRLVATLMTPTALAWLLHPREITAELSGAREVLLGSGVRRRRADAVSRPGEATGGEPERGA